MGMAGMVVVGVADMASVVVVGVIVACLISELVTILKNKLVCKKKKHTKKKKTKKSRPCMGMAGVVVDGVADVATVVIIGVVMVRVVNELFSI